MRTATFTLQTRKGEAEGAIAYEHVDRTWVDKLLGRKRIQYGIGLCSPKDFNVGGEQVVNFGPFVIRIPARNTYIPGLTEQIARGRCERGSNSGLAGTLSLKSYDTLTLAQLHNLVVDAAPVSWWRGIDRPVWNSCY